MSDMETLELDIVLFDGETPEDAAKTVAGNVAGSVTWEIQNPGSAGGWPAVTYYGMPRALRYIKQRYSTLGKNAGRNKGRPPVGKGEKR